MRLEALSSTRVQSRFRNCWAFATQSIASALAGTPSVAMPSRRTLLPRRGDAAEGQAIQHRKMRLDHAMPASCGGDSRPECAVRGRERSAKRFQPRSLQAAHAATYPGA
eukprot:15440573-Alexandrium_andersonii.AAC.1